MTPLPVITDCFRVAWNWSGGGATAANVMHVAAPTKTETDVYNAMNTNVTASMFDATRSTMAVDTVSVLKLNGTSGTVSFPTGRPAKWTGVQASGDYEVAPAYLINLATGLRGPSHRGRLYLPYPAESAVADGYLNSGNRTTLQAAWTAFITATSAAGVYLAVASYVHASMAYPVVATVRSPLATQRRRQRRKK